MTIDNTNWLITGVLSAVLLTICILSSLMFFLTGYICHGLCPKATTHTDSEAAVVSTGHAQTDAGTSPLYDELRLEHVSEAEMRGSNLQMSSNDAYGPLKSLNTH